jgi:hypothetical protein
MEKRQGIKKRHQKIKEPKKVSAMERLKQVISNINVLEARLGQLEQLELDQKRDYTTAKAKIKQELEPLYKEKQLLLTTVDVAEPQYML